jgi:hypothetical protein
MSKRFREYFNVVPTPCETERYFLAQVKHLRINEAFNLGDYLLECYQPSNARRAIRLKYGEIVIYDAYIPDRLCHLAVTLDVIDTYHDHACNPAAYASDARRLAGASVVKRRRAMGWKPAPKVKAVADDE